jgi:hypothetical protein
VKIVPPRKTKSTTRTAGNEESDVLSRPLGSGAALSAPPISHLEEDEDDDYEENDGVDRALAGLNDPSIEQLGPSPRLGGTVGGGRPSDLFGQDAYTLGRATSPRLYGQASQFPTCTQLRVWRWENGIPVGLGAIDAMATEEDFVREFFEAMPKPGQGRMQFKLRPIDIRGEEMGKEITLVISEHHAALQQIRRAKKAEAEENTNHGGPMYGQGNGPVILDRGGDDAGAAYASEMSRMFEKAVEAADQRASALEQALLEERERLRSDDGQRAQERIDLATQAAQGVQAITERMMRDESARSERAMRSQTDQSQMLLTTLTQIFASAQSQQHSISETARMADHQRLEQERQYAERNRMDQEERRKRDVAEMEDRRLIEQRRLEEERKTLHDQRSFEMKQLELRSTRDREEMISRLERARLDEERKAQRDREEMERKMQREQLEWQNRWKMEQEERERRERIDREERERRERDAERKLQLEAEAQRARDSERNRAHELALKQMDVSAGRDREHAERMIQMSRLEMENQRQALDTRIRADKEDQERREQDRIRHHDRMLKDSELQAQKDREHAERMMQLTQMQMRSDSFGGIPELVGKAKDLLGTLGIDAGDLVDRFLNPPEAAPAGGEGGGTGWSDALPKMLGALAEVGKAAFEAQAAKKAPAIPQQPVMIMPQMMPGMNPGMMQGGMPMQMGTPLPGMPGVPSFNVPPPQGARPAITDNQIFEDGEEGGAAGQEAERVEAGNEESEEAPEQEEQRPASQAERLMEAAADAGLPMQTQRKARKALRALVRKISTTKEEDWFGVIASAIQNEIGIYHYVKAVTVKAALVEAGADDELSGRVVESMRKSGMIPDDVPYEEGDQA